MRDLALQAAGVLTAESAGRTQIARFSMERAAARLAAARRRRESADEDEDAEADEAVSAARRVVNQVRCKNLAVWWTNNVLRLVTIISDCAGHKDIDLLMLMNEICLFLLI